MGWNMDEEGTGWNMDEEGTGWNMDEEGRVGTWMRRDGLEHG